MVLKWQATQSLLERLHEYCLSLLGQSCSSNYSYTQEMVLKWQATLWWHSRRDCMVAVEDFWHRAPWVSELYSGVGPEMERYLVVTVIGETGTELFKTREVYLGDGLEFTSYFVESGGGRDYTCSLLIHIMDLKCISWCVTWQCTYTTGETPYDWLENVLKTKKIIYFI